MKTKALLLGALPHAQEGPWVRIDDAEEWQADPRGNYGEDILIELELADGGPPRSYPLGEGLRVSGRQCRAIITEAFNHVKSVTIQLTQVR
jgi:hypothetical protein